MNKYFKTDGIRNNHSFFIQNNFGINFGKALNIFNYEDIYIGYDTRESSQTICNYIISGMLSKGKNVYLLDIASTPCVAFYSYINKTIGIVVSASHNHYLDNGIKVFINGEKISDELITLLENELDKIVNMKDDENIKYGKLYKKSTYEYIQFLKESNVKTKYYLLDTSNGACSYIGQYVYENLINNFPNGKNINNNCGPTNLFRMNNSFNKYEYLLSVDGDGDRINLLDNEGNIYTGEILLYIMNKYLYKNNKVVLSKMANRGIVEEFIKDNTSVIFSDVGDTSLYKTMKENNCLLGAEPSGHIIDFNKTIFGDGLLNGLTIIDIINKNNIDLKKIYNSLTIYPETHLSIKDLSKEKYEIISKFLEDNKEDIYFVLRKSGTENIYRIYLCCKTVIELEIIKKEILSILNE